MRILTVLTYYRPHTSGLTIYAERLSRALLKAGHEVTVLTMQFDKKLPCEEISDGVRIVRVPVLFRISKGVIAPTFGLVSSAHVLRSDIIHLHLPQFDAAGVALRGRILRKPTLITYHCDLQMPPGLVSRTANAVICLMNDLAARFAHRIVTYTSDYAEHSPYMSRFMKKCRITLPPVELPDVPAGEVSAFKAANNPEGKGPVIGMAARLAAEKGVEVLLKALPKIHSRFPDARVFFAGQYREVLAEQEYYERVMPVIRQYEEKDLWKFLGVLSPAQMVPFFKNIDVLVVPSLNSTESFGLVQIEAMMCGTPVVASNLPGVRQPVLTSGMGEIAEIGDSESLAAALLKVLGNRSAYLKDPQRLNDLHSPATVARNYLALYSEIQAELAGNR